MSMKHRKHLNSSSPFFSLISRAFKSFFRYLAGRLGQGIKVKMSRDRPRWPKGFRVGYKGGRS